MYTCVLHTCMCKVVEKIHFIFIFIFYIDYYHQRALWIYFYFIIIFYYFTYGSNTARIPIYHPDTHNSSSRESCSVPHQRAHGDQKNFSSNLRHSHNFVVSPSATVCKPSLAFATESEVALLSTPVSRRSASSMINANTVGSAVTDFLAVGKCCEVRVRLYPLRTVGRTKCACAIHKVKFPYVGFFPSHVLAML